MWDLATIKEMNAKAGRTARNKRLKPYQLKDIDQLNDMPPFPFPNFGDKSEQMDQDHQRIGSLFCDHSGWGSPGEPALTIAQLIEELEELLGKHGPLLLAIESIGQFQLHLGVWK